MQARALEHPEPVVQKTERRVYTLGDGRGAPPRPARGGDGRAGRRPREGAPRRRLPAAPRRGDRPAGRRGRVPGPPRGRLRLALVRDRLVRPRGRRVRPRRPAAREHAAPHDRRGSPASRGRPLRREGRGGGRARPEDGRDPRDGLRARLRPERLHAARHARRVGGDPLGPEPPAEQPRPAERLLPGLDLEAVHGVRDPQARDRPEGARLLPRLDSRSTGARSAATASTGAWTSRPRSRSRATRTSTRWASASGSTRSPSRRSIFGFGRPTGIDLAHEKAGIVPSTEWSLAVRKHPWYAGETISVAIGQGPVLVSALQLARALCGIANADGALPTPHLFHIGENVRSGSASSTGPPRSRSPYLGGPPARDHPRRPLARRERPGRAPRTARGLPASTSAARRAPSRSSARRTRRRPPSPAAAARPRLVRRLRPEGRRADRRRRLRRARGARGERRRAARARNGRTTGSRARAGQPTVVAAGRGGAVARGELSVAPRRGPPPPDRPPSPPPRGPSHRDRHRHGRLDDRRARRGATSRASRSSSRFSASSPPASFSRSTTGSSCSTRRASTASRSSSFSGCRSSASASPARRRGSGSATVSSSSRRSSRGSRSRSSSPGSSRTTTGRSSRPARIVLLAGGRRHPRSARPRCSPTSASPSRTSRSSSAALFFGGLKGRWWATLFLAGRARVRRARGSS